MFQRFCFLLVLMACTLSQTLAQRVYEGSPVFSGLKPVVINMSAPDTNWGFGLKAPKPQHGTLIDQKKIALDATRNWQNQRHAAGNSSHKKEVKSPEIERNWQGPFTNGTPNDNTIAIGNDGTVVAAVNSNVRMFDSDGNTLSVRTLSVIGREVGNLNRAFDPHVLYDMEEDRFILIFLNGAGSGNTSLIVGFSQSKDPTGDWNFYRLPGNVHGNNTWSDYPFMAVNQYELFIPVLLWFDGESGWDSEAQELIWQIDKMKGYAGEELEYKYYDSVQIAKRLVWNTRPVPGSKSHYGPNMYFIGNRAIDETNDSFFLFEITNTLASGKAELRTKIAQADVAYGIPPSAFQPREDDPLRTNYADVHGAFLHAGQIHFVANSRAPSTNSPGIYYGIMRDLSSENPTVKGQILSSDTLDFNYPNIAYAGGFGPDRTCIINFLHSSANTFPGSSMVLVDRNGEFSEVIRLKEGEGHINVMSSDIERWGDYTGIQRKYNEDGVVWIAGSYGSINNGQSTWITEVRNVDPQLSAPTPELNGFSVYPNPAQQKVQVSIENERPQKLTFTLHNMLGKVVKHFGSEHLPAGTTELSFNIAELPKGAYKLQVLNAQGQVQDFTVVK